MLRLAALPLAVDDAEVDFDRLADGRVSVGRHLHKQHILQNSQLSGTSGNRTHVPGRDRIRTGWLLSLSTDASISQICCPSESKDKKKNNSINSAAIKKNTQVTNADAPDGVFFLGKSQLHCKKSSKVNPNGHVDRKSAAAFCWIPCYITRDYFQSCHSSWKK